MDLDHRPQLLFIGTDREVREDLLFVDADTSRSPDIESARRHLLRDDDIRRYGVAVIAYGSDIATGFDPAVTVPLHTRAWVEPIVLVHGVPSQAVQAGAWALGAETVLSLPRDFEALFELVKAGASAGKGAT
jgi:hypothetical protein